MNYPSSISVPFFSINNILRDLFDTYVEYLDQDSLAVLAGRLLEKFIKLVCGKKWVRK